jgi:hypothetical protein
MSMQAKTRVSLLGGLAWRKPKVSAQVAEDYGHDLVGDRLLGTALLRFYADGQQPHQYYQAKCSDTQGEGDFNQRKTSSSGHRGGHVPYISRPANRAVNLFYAAAACPPMTRCELENYIKVHRR